MDKWLQMHLLQPHVLQLNPTKFKEFARSKRGDISKEYMNMIMRLRCKHKGKELEELVPREMRGTIGGLHTWIENRGRDALTKRGVFGPHQTFICGRPMVSEDENGKQVISIALSTENLLLNAWRQAQLGLPQIVQVNIPPRPQQNVRFFIPPSVVPHRLTAQVDSSWRATSTCSLPPWTRRSTATS